MSPRFDSPPTGKTSNSNLDSFSQPRPRPAKSAAELAEVRVKNRRRAYLDRHPGYFESSEHEFADPLLYDSLIRRFQGPEEVKEQNQKQGFARVLEGSLMRGEERLSKMASEDIQGGSSLSSLAGHGSAAPQSQDHQTNPRVSSSTFFGVVPASGAEPDISASALYQGGLIGDRGNTATNIGHSQPGQVNAAIPTPVEEDILGAPPVTTREEGLEMWVTFLRERFIRGGDEDFEYDTVDNDDEYDVLERRDQEEAWYDDEEPGWASDDGDSPHNGDGGNARRRVERVLEGETGIQDY
ncbi:Coiled-coil domain containing protein (DUF2052) domain containing protein [Naviculisporaceae sp. PSN 640]